MKRGAILVLLLWLCPAVARPPNATAPAIAYHVVAQYPHDTGAFTEGLVWVNGRLYESTGLVGRSGVREVELKTGKVLEESTLPEPYFGEGLTAVAGQLVQLTWTNGRGFVYDMALHYANKFRYGVEGWGLTWDGRTLIESDGSSTLHRWNAKDYSAAGDIEVRDGPHPVERLNELEYVKGLIYANVWLSDDVAAIDPASGRVVGWIDMAPLRERFTKPPGWDASAHVPNGIAYNRNNGHFYLTGKCWPALFEVELEKTP